MLSDPYTTVTSPIYKGTGHVHDFKLGYFSKGPRFSQLFEGVAIHKNLCHIDQR